MNTLVHADYTGRVSVLVVKRPDMFGFRNSGGLRLPIEQVIRGGESDCRNRILHQMFLLVGLGERGGSGMPRIYGGWKSQHWRPPALTEKDEPEQTLLMLQMADLLPEDVLAQLRERFGALFDALDHAGRLVMATVALERVVTRSARVGSGAAMLAVSSANSGEFARASASTRPLIDLRKLPGFVPSNVRVRC